MTVNVTDAKVASQILRLIDRMEEIDDVQQVTANYIIDDSIADQIEE
jgi:transcriptional/translational regulatory protein YebC/TACO1